MRAIRYTKTEGGPWYNAKDMLDGIGFDDLYEGVRSDYKTLIFNGVRFHSLLLVFGDEFIRWDAINGLNNEPISGVNLFTALRRYEDG